MEHDGFLVNKKYPWQGRLSSHLDNTEHVIRHPRLTSASLQLTNTLRPGRNRRHFTDDIFKCIFLNENVWISNPIPKGSINDMRSLFQIMAWRRPNDKPLSEPMTVRLLMKLCVIRPQWVTSRQGTDENLLFYMDIIMHLIVLLVRGVCDDKMRPNKSIRYVQINETCQ